MKKRDPFVVLLLSLITFGIYGIYWLYATRKELLPHLQDKKAIWPVWYLFAPLLLTIVGLFVVIAATGMYDIVNVKSDEQRNLATILFFILGIVSVISMLVVPVVWMYKFSFAVSSVVKGMEGMTLFLLGIVLSFLGAGIVWPLIVQIDLNKFIDGKKPEQSPIPTNTPPTPPSPPAPTTPASV